MTNTFRFAGHETFHCKQLWLKKGFDYVDLHQQIDIENGMMEMGLGKNMVMSLRYWLEAFSITKDHTVLSEIGQNIFVDDGWDPYIEDLGTIWLLHYLLVTNNYASTYNLFFNKFRKQRMEFTETHLKLFLQTESQGIHIAEKTLERDIKVLLKNYVLPTRKSNNIEDDYSILFNDLRLIAKIEKDDAGRENWYKTQNSDQIDLPFEIVFFAILQNRSLGRYSDSITFFELLTGDNSPGSIFGLNGDGLYNKIQQIVSEYDGIVYKEDADVKTIQILENYQPLQILKEYYAN